MIITCPACATRYTVKPEVFPASGRSVKCARCAQTWHALPEDEPAEPAAPPGDTDAPREPVPGMSGDRVEVTGESDDDIAWQDGEAPGADGPDAAAIIDDGATDDEDEDETGRDPVSAQTVARARRAARRFTMDGRSAGPARRVQAVAVGAMIAMLVAGIVYRENVVASTPSLAGLYRLIGMEVNLRGLAFEDVEPLRGIEQGIPILRVQGTIRNVSDVSLAVPPVRLSLRSAEGYEIYRWTIQPETEALQPGGAASFRSLLSAPPANAAGIAVRFIDADATRVGLR